MIELLDLHRDWVADAACVDMDPAIFFPPRGESIAPAMMVCNVCSVRAECLEYALEHHERQGIWGGMSERHRRRVLRARSHA